MTHLLSMTLAFLVPMVPAFVLYRTLPSTAVVSGPFKGLTVQLSGAFGGYFLLTLIAFGYLAAQPRPTATDELWEVSGKISVPNGSLMMDRDHLRVSLQPTTFDLSGDGCFSVRLPAKRDASGKAWFPKLVFEAPNLATRTIDLNTGNFSFGQKLKLSTDQERKAISLIEEIELKSSGEPYKTNGRAPESTAPVVVASEVANVRN